MRSFPNCPNGKGHSEGPVLPRNLSTAANLISLADRSGRSGGAAPGGDPICWVRSGKAPHRRIPGQMGQRLLRIHPHAPELRFSGRRLGVVLRNLETGPFGLAALRTRRLCPGGFSGGFEPCPVDIGDQHQSLPLTGCRISGSPGEGRHPVYGSRRPDPGGCDERTPGDEMIRIRRIYDEVLPVNQDTLRQVKDILHARFRRWTRRKSRGSARGFEIPSNSGSPRSTSVA